MTSKDEKGEERLVGCLLSIFSLIVTTPMWLVLLFAIMQVNEMPTWSWVLYWCYVPANVLSVIVAAIVRQLFV